jgi:hypothetical protein
MEKMLLDIPNQPMKTPPPMIACAFVVNLTERAAAQIIEHPCLLLSANIKHHICNIGSNFRI